MRRIWWRDKMILGEENTLDTGARCLHGIERIETCTDHSLIMIREGFILPLHCSDNVHQTQWRWGWIANLSAPQEISSLGIRFSNPLLRSSKAILPMPMEKAPQFLCFNCCIWSVRPYFLLTFLPKLISGKFVQIGICGGTRVCFHEHSACGHLFWRFKTKLQNAKSSQNCPWSENLELHQFGFEWKLNNSRAVFQIRPATNFCISAAHMPCPGQDTAWHHACYPGSCMDSFWKLA